MPDIVTKTSKTGYFGRIGNSIKGIFIGFLLFLVSFGVLFWNEGRFDFSTLAKDATPISSEQVNADAEMNGKLVSTFGKMTTDEQLGDGLYLVPGDYIELQRSVDVYAWTQEEHSVTTTNVGGSETTETTYTYQKEWVSDAPSTSTFAEPTGHQNLPKSIDDQTLTVNSAMVGAYSVEMSSLSLPSSSELALSADNLTGVDLTVAKVVEEKNATDNESFFDEEDSFFDDEESFFDGSGELVLFDTNIMPKLIGSMYIYQGSGSLSSPKIGDMKITYKALPTNTEVTLFGKLDSTKITSFLDKKDNKLYRAFIGSAEDAVATLHGEYKTKLWMFRLVGFFMMWIGLSMLLAPISVILSLLPILETLSGTAIKFATFVISLILSVVTIIVSMIFHSLIALAVVAALGLGFTYWYLNMKGKKAGATKPAAPEAEVKPAE